MKQLHPKAVWLFFWQYLLLTAGFLLPVIFWLAFITFTIASDVQGVEPADRKSLYLMILQLGPLFLLPFLILIPSLSYLIAHLNYKNWRFQITEDALRIEKGIIWKKYVSIPYERIQNVDILRGVFARLLGLSDLQVQTAGASGYSRYGFAEGRLPGLGISEAEEIRDELIKRAKGKKPGV